MSARKPDTERYQDFRQPRGKTPFRMRVRVILGLAASSLILVIGAIIVPLAAFCTLFRARDFYSKLVSQMARLGLGCCGVKLREHRSFAYAQRQTVYISNHTSSLDFLIITALGLPRTRYFLSGFLRSILPLGIIGYVIGVFWTPPQTQGARRTRLFQRAERLLRQTGESVFLTPEGQIIGRYNRGAFHLATNLRAPIQPIFVEIPNDTDPGRWMGLSKVDLRPGYVDVHFKDPIDTSQWDVEDVDQNRAQMKIFYSKWRKELGR